MYTTRREARALARAGRAAGTQPQPPQPGVVDTNKQGDELFEQVVGMTNKMKCSDPAYFNDMLRRIGVLRACINQLASNGFNTIKSIVMHYKGNIGSFQTYLKIINKSMQNATNPV